MLQHAHMAHTTIPDKGQQALSTVIFDALHDDLAAEELLAMRDLATVWLWRQDYADAERLDHGDLVQTLARIFDWQRGVDDTYRRAAIIRTDRRVVVVEEKHFGHCAVRITPFDPTELVPVKVADIVMMGDTSREVVETYGPDMWVRRVGDWAKDELSDERVQCVVFARVMAQVAFVQLIAHVDARRRA